jgi:hypothetical protein
MTALLLALLTSAYAEDCPQPPTLTGLQGDVARGDIAFQEADAAALHTAALVARERVRCLVEPLGIPDAADLFRLWGYDAFVRKERAAAERYFRVAKDLEPVSELPAAVVAERHPMRQLYDSLDAQAPETRLYPVPDGHTVRVNGIESVVVPTSGVWVLQQIDDQARVVRSMVIDPGSVAPEAIGIAKEPRPEGSGPGLSVLGQAGLWLRNGRTTGTIGPAVRLDVPVTGGLGVDAALSGGLSVVKEGVVLVPSLRAGVRWGVSEGATVQPRIGLAAMAASHAGAVVAPGGVVTGGARIGAVDLDVFAGWAGGFTAGIGVGPRF